MAPRACYVTQSAGRSREDPPAMERDLLTVFDVLITKMDPTVCGNARKESRERGVSSSNTQTKTKNASPAMRTAHRGVRVPLGWIALSILGWPPSKHYTIDKSLRL